MKNLLSLLLACVVFYSCTKPTTIKTEREGEPEIYSVEDEDPEMNVAIKKAIATIKTFKTALVSQNENYSDFSLKQRFDTADGGEHIWLNEIWIEGDVFYGVINNEPELTDEVHLGDTIKIKSERISDWMYIEHQRVRGGYTLRVLRDRMSEEERQQFDAATGLLFE